MSKTYTPITDWTSGCLEVYEERARLARAGRDVLVEERAGRCGPLREYRLVECK